MKTATATAHSNIALVKYWGKREGTAPALNLPAVGSLSMTLDALKTVTRIEPHANDTFVLDEVQVGGSADAKVWRHLDRLWNDRHTTARPPCRVTSVNHLPTAAGLASSASGFAALTVAASAAFELGLDTSALSAWSRIGSGSAARSVFGGFVRLDAGERPDGSDCVARPLAGADHWPLELVVVQTTLGPKPIGSTEGMQRCAQTSPYYRAWVETSNADLDAAESALRARDLAVLGEVVEHSCFKMHASMMATRPPILYWHPATIAVIRAVWDARTEGVVGYVTMDAGPHVKILCEPSQSQALVKTCKDLPGVEAVTVCKPGPGATVEVTG